MKSKQEVIQEAWGENYEEFKDNIDDNGWAIYPHSQKHEMIENIRPIEFRFNSSDFRPKSLAGIETNNGWTRIESEEDLPKEDGTYYVMTKDGMKSLYWMSGMGKRYNVKKWMEYKPTHYLLEVVPNPPIY